MQSNHNYGECGKYICTLEWNKVRKMLTSHTFQIVCMRWRVCACACVCVCVCVCVGGVVSLSLCAAGFLPCHNCDLSLSW